MLHGNPQTNVVDNEIDVSSRACGVGSQPTIQHAERELGIAADTSAKIHNFVIQRRVALDHKTRVRCLFILSWAIENTVYPILWALPQVRRDEA